MISTVPTVPHTFEFADGRYVVSIVLLSILFMFESY